MSENENFKAKRREEGLTAMTTTDTIDLNDDAVFAREVVAFVRNEPNKIWLGTVAEEQAEIAQRLARKDPSILEDPDRLISTTTSMHYVERGHEAQVQSWADFTKRHNDYEQQSEPKTPPKYWRIWNGRVNRACISATEYRRRSAERKAAGEAIDIATAEFHWWYGQTLDPYDDMLPLLDEHHQIGREHFCSAPGSDVLVNLGDLPEEKQEAAWKRMLERDPNAVIRIRVDAKGNIVATGFPRLE
jgi:hypothetical protein